VTEESREAVTFVQNITSLKQSKAETVSGILSSIPVLMGFTDFKNSVLL